MNLSVQLVYFSANTCQQYHFLELIFVKEFACVYWFFSANNILSLLKGVITQKIFYQVAFSMLGCRTKASWIGLRWPGWGRLWKCRKWWWLGFWDTGARRRSICKGNTWWSQVIHGPDGPGTGTYQHWQKFHHPEANGMCVFNFFPFLSLLQRIAKNIFYLVVFSCLW